MRWSADFSKLAAIRSFFLLRRSHLELEPPRGRVEVWLTVKSQHSVQGACRCRAVVDGSVVQLLPLPLLFTVLDRGLKGTLPTHMAPPGEGAKHGSLHD